MEGSNENNDTGKDKYDNKKLIESDSDSEMSSLDDEKEESFEKKDFAGDEANRLHEIMNMRGICNCR